MLEEGRQGKRAVHIKGMQATLALRLRKLSETEEAHIGGGGCRGSARSPFVAGRPKFVREIQGDRRQTGIGVGRY